RILAGHSARYRYCRRRRPIAHLSAAQAGGRCPGGKRPCHQCRCFGHARPRFLPSALVTHHFLEACCWSHGHNGRRAVLTCSNTATISSAPTIGELRHRECKDVACRRFSRVVAVVFALAMSLPAPSALAVGPDDEADSMPDVLAPQSGPL